MGFIKGMVFGMAVYAAVQHLTKKDILTGRSLLDELMDKAPRYIENVKVYVTEVKEELSEYAPPPSNASI